MLRFLARLVLVPLGVTLAALAALLVGSTGAGAWHFGDSLAEFLATTGLALALQAVGNGDPSAAATFMGGMLLVSGGVLVLPVVLMALLGELFGLTSWLAYVLGTGLLYAAIPVLLPGNPADPGWAQEVGLGFAATGFAAGFVYWLVAGRSARPAPRLPAPSRASAEPTQPGLPPAVLG